MLAAPDEPAVAPDELPVAAALADGADGHEPEQPKRRRRSKFPDLPEGISVGVLK